MKHIIIYLILILFVTISCKKDEDIQDSKPGYFIITEIKNPNLKNTWIISDKPIKTKFFLGDLKASKEFYFILSNGGENPIFDIKLETDSPQFIIIPESISILNGNNSTDYDNLIPLISLGIIHGTQLNGVGYANLLPMGENNALLTITGKTIENEDTIDLKSDFSFTVNAKIMDINLTVNEQEVNLSYPDGSVSSNLGGLGFIRYYIVTSNLLNIENIGNVEISLNITAIDSNGNDVIVNKISLTPDQSSDIDILYHVTFFSLNSNGTITDDSRIQLGNDGNGYFAIEKLNE